MINFRQDVYYERAKKLGYVIFKYVTFSVLKCFHLQAQYTDRSLYSSKALPPFRNFSANMSFGGGNTFGYAFLNHEILRLLEHTHVFSFCSAVPLRLKSVHWDIFNFFVVFYISEKFAVARLLGKLKFSARSLSVFEILFYPQQSMACLYVKTQRFCWLTQLRRYNIVDRLRFTGRFSARNFPKWVVFVFNCYIFYSSFFCNICLMTVFLMT